MTSTLAFIKQIIDKEMDLPIGRCFAYNNENELPKDDNIFVCLYFASKTPYSNISKYKETANGLQEVQIMNMAEEIEIAICSKNTDARERCHEVLMALRSVYSQQIQELNHIHISTISEITDNSFLEATARLNRFDIRCTVIRAYEKVKPIDYYDKFSGSLWVENNDSVIKSDV